MKLLIKLIFSTAIVTLLTISSASFAGLKYNKGYYSKAEIKDLIEKLDNPFTKESVDEYYQIMSRLQPSSMQQQYSLSYESIDALNYYQQNGYQAIRRAILNGENTEEINPIIEHIDSAFEQGIKFTGETYRGESLIKAYSDGLIKVGDIVSPSTFLSTSVSARSTEGFYGGQRSMFELSNGEASIIMPDMRTDELEVLVNRNTFFEVTAIDANPEMGMNNVIYREIAASDIGNRPIKDMHTGENISALEACEF
ncbi:ADP-ribosyltransferase [Vibrio pectenicida]